MSKTTIIHSSIHTKTPVQMFEDERAMVRRCQHGDTSAFNELFKRYRTQIYQLSYCFTQRHADSEDVLQNTFVRAFKYIQRFDTKHPFYPWLRTIVANESLTYLKKQNKRHHALLESPSDEQRNLLEALPDMETKPVDKKIGRKQLDKQSYQTIQKLPEQQRICFTLYEIEHMKVREIAETLGCTEGTVKTHLHRARIAFHTLSN
jgi:RNA polymerase sigma-70 factor, ECF subfamily